MGLNGNYYLVYDGTNNVNNLAYTHSNLSPGFVYQYKLVVLNFNGPSDYSSVASRAACEVPSDFNSVYIELTSSTLVTVSWL